MAQLATSKKKQLQLYMPLSQILQDEPSHASYSNLAKISIYSAPPTPLMQDEVQTETQITLLFIHYTL